MILQSLQLRGAKGIKYGMGLDEIEIDFTKFQPGLVAIIGRNGSGKTTLLENLTPFRTLFSRKGKLQLHYSLADSHRILKFRIGEDDYSAELYIDVEKDKSGAVLRKNKVAIASKPSDYDKEIDKLFVSKALFEQSLFFGQDTDRISDLRSGEAKEFMISLLRLNLLESFHKRASIRMNQATRDYESIETRLREYTQQIQEKDATQKDLDDTTRLYEQSQIALKVQKDALQEITTNLSKEAIVDGYTEELYNIRTELNTWDQNARKRADENRELLSKYAKESLEEEQDRLKVASARIIVTQEQVNEYENLEVERNTLKIKIENLKDLRHTVTVERSEIEAPRLAKQASLDSEQATIKIKLANAHRAASIIDEVPCDEDLGSRCILLSDAQKAQKSILELDQALLELERKRQRLKDWRKEESDELQGKLDEYSNQMLPLEDQLQPVINRLQSLSDVKIKWADKQKLIQDLSEVAHKINTCDEVVQKEKVDLESFKKLLRDKKTILLNKQKLLEQKITDQTMDWDSFKQKKITAETSINNIEPYLLDVNRRIGELQQKLKSIDELVTKVSKTRKSSRIALRNAGDWKVISEAFSRNGIQTFEIKKALPSIVSMMNELLIGELGQKFSLNFRMKREGTKGQLIDTFDPLITRYNDDDAIAESDVPLGNLSRGERILIFVAMSEAVGVYLRNSIGLDLKTSFVDEADGPLDPTNRLDYLKTRTHVHDICGLHHTFMISQSPDIYEKIPQKLVLGPHGVEIII